MLRIYDKNGNLKRVVTDKSEVKEFFDRVKDDSSSEKSSDERFNFTLSSKQKEKYDEWRRNHECPFRKDGFRYVGAIGGADTFHITGTGLGYIVSVDCACGAELDLTEDF